VPSTRCTSKADTNINLENNKRSIITSNETAQSCHLLVILFSAVTTSAASPQRNHHFFVSGADPLLSCPQEMRLSQRWRVGGGGAPQRPAHQRRALAPSASTLRGALTNNLANAPDFPKAKTLATQEHRLDVTLVVGATHNSFCHLRNSFRFCARSVRGGPAAQVVACA
jgi:hypothetical protein